MSSSIQGNLPPYTQTYGMISDRKAHRIVPHLIQTKNLISLTIKGPFNEAGEGLSPLGVRTILHAVRDHQHLTKLDFQGNPEMGDEAAKILNVWLKNNTTIRDLSLCGCGLTDVGIVRLIPGLLESPSLERLCVNDNRIDESWSALRSVVKKVNITLY
jgi:hypothetical protein